jgi:hypothetical protein
MVLISRKLVRETYLLSTFCSTGDQSVLFYIFKAVFAQRIPLEATGSVVSETTSTNISLRLT